MTELPKRWPSVIPRLFVRDPMQFVNFLRGAFDASGEFQADRPTELRIGDSMLMVSGDEVREPTSSCFYVYVEDADATYSRALSCGAESLEEPRDTPTVTAAR